MPHSPEPAHCSDGDCGACRLEARLIDGGAQAVPWDDLSEHSCRLRIQCSIGIRCVHGLRLDVPGAGYRLVSKARDTKMCDFAVLATSGDAAHVVAVELKSGVAYAEDVEQLSEGLRAMHENLDESELNARPQALLVAGRELDKLRFALRDRLTSLRFGGQPVRLQIVECGYCLNL